jgi:putative flippase GtrA
MAYPCDYLACMQCRAEVLPGTLVADRYGAHCPFAGSIMQQVSMATFIRFLIVGALNTLFGYTIIFVGLLLGLGDYLANALGYAIGIPLSYGLHRRWTFAPKAPASWAEALRFGICFLIAYSANLAVIAIGRSAGRIEDPLVQGAAIVSYAGLFFILTRFIVFSSRDDPEGGRFGSKG